MHLAILFQRCGASDDTNREFREELGLAAHIARLGTKRHSQQHADQHQPVLKVRGLDLHGPGGWPNGLIDLDLNDHGRKLGSRYDARRVKEGQWLFAHDQLYREVWKPRIYMGRTQLSDTAQIEATENRLSPRLG